MIDFKISVFIDNEVCTSTPYPKVGGFNDVTNFVRYKVYINEVEVVSPTIGITGELNTFVAQVPINTSVNVKVVDLTGEVDTFNQSFLVYNQPLWMDIHLLHNKQFPSVIDYNCYLGVNGEGNSELAPNNIGDFLGGSNYFEWEIHSSSSTISGINDIVGVIKVERPRDVNGILIPFYTVAWDNSDNTTVVSGTYSNNIFTDAVIQGYESYFTSVSNRYLLTLDGTITTLYLAYLLQSSPTVTQDCCGGNTTIPFVDCTYPFEVTRTIEKAWSYCSAKFDFIDVPCSRDKWLYKTSTSKYPLTVEYYCDGQWKFLGQFSTSFKLEVEKVCTPDEFDIRVSCLLEDVTDCCGGTNHSEGNTCTELRTIKTLPYCATGEITLQQDVCEDTIGCDDCGDTSLDRIITEQPITINSIREWNNLVIRYYHKEEIIEEKVYYKNTDEPINNEHPNTVTYKIERLDPVTKLYKVYYESNPIDETVDSTEILYTPTDSGIYKFSIILSNACKVSTYSKELYIYAKSYIERLNCSDYRLYHCVDRDKDLLIRKYKDKSLIYSYDSATNTTVETDLAKVSYNEDYFAYDITFTKDDVYELLYEDNNFIILHDCFITTCHQEYVKALLCEGDICKELLDQCKVTDDTLLKTYLIQKYVLLYDVYKSLASKIVNIEYSHIILPNVLLEENYCVDLYNLFDVIEKLKELCITCQTKTEEDDCGCK